MKNILSSFFQYSWIFIVRFKKSKIFKTNRLPKEKKLYVAKKKKKERESTYKSLQPCRPVSVPVSLIAFRRTVNGTAFFSPDACANKVQTINRTAMQMYAVLQVVKKKKRFISRPCEIDQPFMTMKQKTWLAASAWKIFFFLSFFFCDGRYKNIKRTI